MNVFDEAEKAWNDMAPLRERRNRYKMFTYGRQWDDTVRDPDTGLFVSERSLLSRDGRPPLTNNLIRQLVKSIIGRYRRQAETAIKRTATDCGKCNGEYKRISEFMRRMYLLHRLDELDCRLLEEFLISGVAVQRLGIDDYSRKHGYQAVANVSPECFFVSQCFDPRGIDIELIGMMHHWRPEEIVVRWGGQDRDKALQLLARLRSMVSETPALTGGDGSLFRHAPPSMVRVIEVWRLESHEFFHVHDPEKGLYYIARSNASRRLKADNARRQRRQRPLLNYRWQLQRIWTGRWFLPDGSLLDTVRLPPGQKHPFAVKFYPLIDGEIHSLVEDVVDQQKYVNRLINLLDRMMATAAKGALLFPVDALPEGCDFEAVTRQWSATDGVVLYKGLHGDDPPRQLTTTVGDVGARDLLRTEMELFKEISGVGDTLAGRTPASGVGAERYGMEIDNASVSIKDILDTFGSLIDHRNLRLISQYLSNNQNREKS